MSKMTRWFPPRITPVHKGIYQIKFYSKESVDPPKYATWNGFMWSTSCYSLDDSLHQHFNKSIQHKYWRGFTKEQK